MQRIDVGRIVTPFVLMVAVFVTQLLFADTATVNGITWTYTVSNGEASFGFGAVPKTTEGALTIPSTLGGCPVTSIGSFAFEDCSGIASVTIPDSVTSIGYCAFKRSGLVDITIPNSVTNLESHAFYECSGLKSITISDRVTNIGQYTFCRCTNLTSITLPNSITNLGFGTFYQCNNIVQITLPSNITSIAGCVFSGCNSLAHMTIPQSVTDIGLGAFDGCSDNLFDATIILGVKLKDGWVVGYDSCLYGGLDLTGIRGILGGAFRNCHKLTSVTIPDGITCIEEDVFRGCSGLTSVTIPASVMSIGKSAFEDCSGLASITMPDSVKSIGDSAFFGCRGLTNMMIPEGVMSLGHSAFSGCSGLTSVEIPSSVTNIGASAFSSCRELVSFAVSDGNLFYKSSGGLLLSKDGKTLVFGINGHVTIPDSVTSIGPSAFSWRAGLVSVSIPNSVTNIGSDAFSSCTGLASVAIPDSVTGIGSYAFSGCIGLDSVTIPNSVTNIGSYAFFGCSGLASVIIPDSVTNIGYSAFSGCSGITSVTIPQSVCSSFLSNVFPAAYRTITNVVISADVTRISFSTFIGCNESLFDLETIPGVKLIDGWAVGHTEGLYGDLSLIRVRGIGDSAFSGCNGLTSVTIPDSVTSIGSAAFFGCSGLTSVTIGNGVKLIGASAFSGCSGLSSVTIGNSVTSIGDYAFLGCSSLTNVIFYGDAPSGVSESDVLSCATSVHYRKKYASSYEQLVPVSKFGGYVLIEADSLNKDGCGFERDSELPWVFDYDVTHDGEGSMRSGRIEHSESTWIETTVNGAGQLSFWWKASSETYDSDVFDYAYLSVDGVPQGSLEEYKLQGVAIGGKTDWMNVVFDVTGDGLHTIRWTYCKDEVDESDVGEDCVWLDEISFAPFVAVTFSIGDGVGVAPTSVNAIALSKIVLPTDIGFSRAKHTFVGWSDGAHIYDAEAAYVVPDSNVVFSAVWAANTLAAPIITSADVADGGTIETAYATIEISAESGATIYYTLDGTEPTTNSLPYTAPFVTDGMSVTIRAIAVKDNYFDSPIAEFSFTRKPYSAAECLNVAEEAVATGGENAAWVRVLGETAHDGVAALRSGTIGDGESSSVVMTVEGAGEIGFCWKVSSEISRNRKFDYVSFLIDGKERSWLGGEREWTNEVFAVSGEGTHTLEWVYQKNDNGLTQGEDCAWLDEVTWTPAGGSTDTVVDVGGGKSVTVPGAWIEEHSALVEAAGGDASAALVATAANGRKVWECYALGLDPEDNSATNDFRITSFPLKADGTPDIEHIVFEPPQARWNVPGARAVLKGAAALDAAEWPEVTEQNKASFRFFKVEVEMP